MTDLGLVFQNVYDLHIEAPGLLFAGRVARAAGVQRQLYQAMQHQTTPCQQNIIKVII